MAWNMPYSKSAEYYMFQDHIIHSVSHLEHYRLGINYLTCKVPLQELALVFKLAT